MKIGLVANGSKFKNNLIAVFLALTGLGAANHAKAQSHNQNNLVITAVDSNVNHLLTYSSQDLVDFLKNNQLSSYVGWFENAINYWRNNKKDSDFNINKKKIDDIYYGIFTIIGHGDRYVGRDFAHVVGRAVNILGDKSDFGYDLAKVNFKYWAETDIDPAGNPEEEYLSTSDKKDYEIFNKMSKEEFDIIVKLVKIHKKLGID